MFLSNLVYLSKLIPHASFNHRLSDLECSALQHFTCLVFCWDSNCVCGARTVEVLHSLPEILRTLPALPKDSSFSWHIAVKSTKHLVLSFVYKCRFFSMFMMTSEEKLHWGEAACGVHLKSSTRHAEAGEWVWSQLVLHSTLQASLDYMVRLYLTISFVDTRQNFLTVL